MTTIQFDNGKEVDFDGTPTPEDVDYVAKQIGIIPETSTPQVSPQERAQNIIKGSTMGQNAEKATLPLTDIVNVAKSGFQYGQQGYEEAQNATNPLDLMTGVGKMLGGTAGVISSPLTPIFKPISMGIEAIGNAIGSIPAVQDFATSNAGNLTYKGIEFLNNLNSIAGILAGAKAGVPGTIKEKASIETMPKGEIPPSGPTSFLHLAEPKSMFTPEIQSVIDNRIDSLQQIENNNGPVRRIVTNATKSGIDVKKLVSQTDLLVDSVDGNGNINTIEKGGAVDQFNQFMNQYESAVSDGLKREGISIPIKDVYRALKSMADSSNIAGASKVGLVNKINAEIKGLGLDVDGNGNISLDKLQDAKITTTNAIDYTKPQTKIVAKMIATAYRTLIEKNSQLPVNELNTELAKYYSIADFLESLNGKKVEGGKMMKYFAQVTGAIGGSHFGLLGTIIGAELMGKIKGFNLSTTFGEPFGGTMEATPLMKTTALQNTLPRLGLPAPIAGSTPKVNLGSGASIPLLPSEPNIPPRER